MRIFPTPLSFNALAPNFWTNFLSQKLVLGLSVGEDFVILACVVFTQCQRVTDGQTDIPIVASTGLAATADVL